MFGVQARMLESSAGPSILQRHLYGAAGLTLLVLLYLLPGTIGHDPWRGDDLRHFAVIHGLLSGDWLLFPMLAGDPAPGAPPLYYWTGAAFAIVLGGQLPVHDAARLATPFFVALAIFWIARCAARLYGKASRTPAALLTLGTLGLVVHAHESQPMAALMAMQAMTLAGLSRIPDAPLKGALQAAAGMALAVLAGGPLGLLLTLPLFALVILCCPEARNARASGALILAVTAGVGGSALWPALVGYHDPALLDLWWREAWTGFAADLIAGEDLPDLLELLGWAAWPLWPIALWAVWQARRKLLGLPWLLPIGATLLGLAGILARGSISSAMVLPLLPALALLAGGGVLTLRRGAANAFDWFAVTTFTVFGLLVWLAWSAQVFDWPPGLARSLQRMAPQFVLDDAGPRAYAGALICIVWLALVWSLPRSIHRGPANWAMGMTMLWCLAVTLLMPWIDHSRNYRPVAGSLALALEGERPGCVAGIDLGTSHRAAFDYFAGIRPRPVTGNTTACAYLLVVDDPFPLTHHPGPQWQQIWEYRQGGGKKLELFRLYRRD